VAAHCEYSSGTSYSVKAKEFLDQLSGFQILKDFALLRTTEQNIDTDILGSKL
jgi:hypothetical protein